MIALAWAEDFWFLIVVLIVALFAVAFLVCLLVGGATAAWRRVTRRDDREFGAMLAAEFKRDPGPRPTNEEAAAFIAGLKEQAGWK